MILPCFGVKSSMAIAYHNCLASGTSNMSLIASTLSPCYVPVNVISQRKKNK